MSTPFKMQHLPARGMFTVTHPKGALVEQMMRALKAGPTGGFVALRGHPVFIREVAVDSKADTMTVRYERVGSRPRTTRARELGELRKSLLSETSMSTPH